MSGQPNAGRPVKETRTELTDGRARIRRYRAGDADALFEAATESQTVIRHAADRLSLGLAAPPAGMYAADGPMENGRMR